MLGIFLLILLLLMGLSVLSWLTNYTPVAEGPMLPAFTKQENFLSPQDQSADYRLLAGVFPLENSMAKARTDITSEACRLRDAALDLQLDGDYSQRTNNYPRKFPDSCSAPRHELLLNFYTSSDKKPFQAGVPLC